MFRQWKTECVNGHVTSSSVKVACCVHCKAPFKVQMEVSLGLTGLKITNLLTGTSRRIPITELLGGFK